MAMPALAPEERDPEDEPWFVAGVCEVDCPVIAVAELLGSVCWPCPSEILELLGEDNTGELLTGVMEVAGVEVVAEFVAALPPVI